ncbi:carboxylic ester hydrolase [Macrosteles quadrilineatus]|uniref:carboxylic ester hydrolase n=1 Tax=Macrosteles quadrilineatus TaxID=74068 RepID=UPI0023E215DE|nr:carboxylic ester hydrolase [Macrosteles quadrilineatus]
MARVCMLLLCLCLVGWSSGSSRQKRIVGGEPASPPPPGASEDENVVENPALTSVQPVKPTTTTTTTRPRLPADDGGPIVFLRRGRRQARVTGVKEPEGIYAFKGLRYARPPTESLRFQRPRKFKPDGELEAKAHGPPCPQTIGDHQVVIGNEDCLFLDVYTPQLPRSSDTARTSTQQKGYPVLFWIHGGGFRRGAGSQYGPAHLCKKGVVVVTIQYRLGSLGFLSAGREELPGNAGLFDILASLDYTRRYIQFFGGDPSRIIPAGQGTGASVAMMLGLSQFSKGFIRGVIAMSGSAISSFAVDQEPEKTSRSVSAVEETCQSQQDTLAFVRCMQKLPLETILRADDKLQSERLSSGNPGQSYLNSISKLLNPGPTVEGEDDFRFLPNFLTSKPSDSLQKGDIAKVPLLTGVTKEETSTSAKGGGIATQLLGQLEATEEAVESLIPQLLNINSGIFGNTSLNPVLSQLFSNTGYLKGITSSLNSLASTVDKIIEMTTDALFNLPAFLSSQSWSKKDKVYLYRFEHESQTSTADDFLQDYPLTQQKEDKPVPGVGHGDDLIYLFDLKSVDGKPLFGGELTDPHDITVREHFTDMVAEFCKTGLPKISGRSLKPFTAEGGDYVIINETPKEARGFRKCQMGLWAGLTEVLKSAECSFLQLGDVLNNVVTDNLQNVTVKATDTLVQPATGLANGLNNTATSLTGGLTGLIGGKKPAQGATTKKPSNFLGLG